MGNGTLRQVILDAALIAFTEEGYEHATIAGIRARAGVSNGAVFHHFKSKEAISEALYLSGIASFQKGLTTIIERRPESVRAAIRASVAHHLNWNETHRDLAFFMYNRGRPDWAPGRDERVGALNSDIAARIRAWLDPFIARGEIRPVSATVLAACVVGPAHFVAQRWLSGVLTTPPTAFADELGEAACAALIPPSVTQSTESGEPPMKELVTYEQKDGIAKIVMDDDKVNVMSSAMLKALHTAFDRAEREGAIVILTSAARHFSAGFDLKVFAGNEPVAVHEMLKLGAELALRILSFPMPVIAACNGNAFPMGAFLILASDVRIGAEGQYLIGLNEVAIGLTLPLFAVEIARQRLTPAYFNRTVTGELLGPEEAVTAGYFDRLVPASDLMAAAEATAETLKGVDLVAHKATKARVRGEAIKAVRAAIDAEITLENYEARMRA